MWKLPMIQSELGNRCLAVINPSNRPIVRVEAIHDCTDDRSIAFCNRQGIWASEVIKKTNAGVIICDIRAKKFLETTNTKTLLFVNDPRLEFARLVSKFFIHEEQGLRVVSGVNVHWGNNCSIGGRGFGFVREEDGSLLRFPSLGRVILGDNVEIDNNVCIDRGTLGDTMIGEGTKIDNHVHISHNVVIGRHCMIIAHSIICGSVTIGDRCLIGAGSIIRDQVTIGNDVTVGCGAVVVKDVKDNLTVIGNPAKLYFKKEI